VARFELVVCFPALVSHCQCQPATVSSAFVLRSKEALLFGRESSCFASMIDCSTLDYLLCAVFEKVNNEDTMTRREGAPTRRLHNRSLGSSVSLGSCATNLTKIKATDGTFELPSLLVLLFLLFCCIKVDKNHTRHNDVYFMGPLLALRPFLARRPGARDCGQPWQHVLRPFGS